VQYFARLLSTTDDENVLNMLILIYRLSITGHERRERAQEPADPRRIRHVLVDSVQFRPVAAEQLEPPSNSRRRVSGRSLRGRRRLLLLLAGRHPATLRQVDDRCRPRRPSVVRRRKLRRVWNGAGADGSGSRRSDGATMEPLSVPPSPTRN